MTDHLDRPHLVRENSVAVGLDPNSRTVTVRLCRWDEPREVRDPGANPYREIFPRGSIDLAENVHVRDAHHGNLIGRAIPETYRDEDDGPLLDLVLARTQAGNDAIALLEADVIRSVSMEFVPVAQSNGPDGLVVRDRNRLDGVALAFRPAHDAPVLAMRSEDPTNPDQGDNMHTTPDTPIPAGSPDPSGDAVTTDVLTREIEELRREISSHRPDPAPAHPLARFESFESYYLARAEDPDNVPTLFRDLADQISSESPGVIPPTWATEIYGIVAQSRPVIDAFGVRSAGSSGMAIDYPYVDPALDLDSIVAVQAAEKTAINGAKIKILRGSDSLVTHAAGSDISLQLIRRSQPGYLDAHGRILAASYARVTEAFATDAAEKGAGNAEVYDLASDTTGSALKAFVFGASMRVEDATGRPAGFCLCADDVYEKMGGVLAAEAYGTQNVPGEGSARTLSLSIHGLPLIRAKFMTAGNVLVSNRGPAGFHEDGPMTATGDDVERLGQDVAIWGLGAFAVNVAAGLQLGNAGGLVPTAGQSSSKKK